MTAISAGAPPRVSVVVIPRERFSTAVRSLDSLLDATPAPFELIYVDAGLPAAVRRAVERRLAARPDARLITAGGYVPPNRARNLGFRHSGGDYVVFADNDVIFGPGWLAPLLRTAEETGAAAVGPLICEREPVHTFLHDVGGTVILSEKDGRRRFEQGHLFSEYRWRGKPFSHLRSTLERTECDVVEFHCVLVRRAALQQLGSLDEGMISMWEHTDMCLGLKQAGGTVWVEPSSVVTFLRPPPLEPMDWPYFFVRWSDGWARASDERLAEKWGRFDKGSLPFTQSYRLEAFGRTKTLLDRVIGRRSTRRALRAAAGVMEALGRRRLSNSQPGSAG